MKNLIRQILKEETDRSDVIYNKDGNVFKSVMKILDKKYRIYIPKYFKQQAGRKWAIEGIGEGGSRYGVSDWDVEGFLGNKLGFDDEQLEFLYKSWVIRFLEKHRDELDLNENDLEYYGVGDATKDEYKIGLKENVPIYKQPNPFKKVFGTLKKEFPQTPDYILQDYFRNHVVNEPQNRSTILNTYYGDIIPSLDDYWYDYLKGPWKLQIINVNPEDFDDFTVNAFLDREFGEVDAYQVPNDEKRMKTQKRLAKGKGMNEPVIVVRKPNGKYELVEGWHRTMSILLLGDNGEDLKNWDRVKIRAFVKGK